MNVGNDINIAFGVTVDWLDYTAVTITSILCNSNPTDRYNFFIMSESFDDKIKQKFENLAKIKNNAEFNYIKINHERFAGCIHDWRGVSASYRLILSSLLDIDKILYLDSDIIFLNDAKMLYSKPINNYYIAAVKDKMWYSMRERIQCENLPFFINSGVLLMNLEEFRKNNLEAQIFDKLTKYDWYTDQDVLNDVCAGKIKLLPIKYNLMPMEGSVGDFIYKDLGDDYRFYIQNPYLIHYSMKPWVVNTTPFAEKWYKYKKIMDKLL